MKRILVTGGAGFISSNMIRYLLHETPHDVELHAGTRLEALLGERAPVKSHHHQGLGRLGTGLREAARADDGTVEAFEHTDSRFAVGVLWHPEEGEDFRLFQELVEQARGYRRARG